MELVRPPSEPQKTTKFENRHHPDVASVIFMLCIGSTQESVFIFLMLQWQVCSTSCALDFFGQAQLRCSHPPWILDHLGVDLHVVAQFTHIIKPLLSITFFFHKPWHLTQMSHILWLPHSSQGFYHVATILTTKPSRPCTSACSDSYPTPLLTVTPSQTPMGPQK